MFSTRGPFRRYLGALGLATAVSYGLFIVGAIAEHNWEFNYLLWNLFLAWIPLGLAVRLLHTLARKPWSSWEALALSVLWLGFLPNSFYLISDYIHIQTVSRGNVLYDVVLFTAFVYTGVALGFTSLYLVHREIARRYPHRIANVWVGATLLLSSIALYIGRDLRWNTWDVIINPAGMLFDLSNQVLHLANASLYVTIISFFVLLSSMYYVVWRGLQLARSR
jgi:uncharacterized membrane protein